MSRNLLPATLTSLLMGSTAIADVPSVAVDIAPVHSLVARVMDGVGSPDLIIPPGASPHEYSLRPSEAAALEGADIVFWIGEGLTPWLEDAIDTLAGDASVAELLEADGIALLDFREDALFEAHEHGDEEEHGHDDHAEEDGHDHDDHAEGEHDDHDHDEHAEGKEEHGHEDHADADEHDHDHEDHAEGEHDDHGHEDHAEGEDHGHEDHAEEKHDDHDHEDHADAHGHEGHDHGAHDPHAWLSPDSAATWLNVIAAELSAADPDNAGAYFANAAAGREEIEALKAEVSGILDPVRGHRFIVFHDAYQYFEVAFDFPASGAISLSDASDPSPARIAEIQERVRDEGIDCVLAEPQYNPGLVATVLEGTEASTGVIDPLGSNHEPGMGLYPQLLRDMAGTLAECL